MLSIDDIKRLVEPVARRYGVDSVRLFGSYARGEATPSSDVDLLVDTGIVYSLFKVGGLYGDLKEALGMEIDLITINKKENDFDFLKFIAVDEVIIYEK
ncbi:MAG: nucleotidyltransferase domain-containing protein [Deltaproteobacteria bacterium]|nr:nucleotidyltransferase domain-containing protein [Deltaproteobacteria bacterium]